MIALCTVRVFTTARKILLSMLLYLGLISCIGAAAKHITYHIISGGVPSTSAQPDGTFFLVLLSNFAMRA